MEQRDGVFAVGAGEQRAGRKRIAGLVAGIWGPLRLAVTTYATGGGAATTITTGFSGATPEDER